MTDKNKSLVAYAKALKKSLSNHGIDAPYTAVRAAILEAKGLHPHAFGPNEHKSGKASNTTAVSESSTQVSVDKGGFYRNKIAEMQKLIDKAPVFFHPGYDFDGEKRKWLEDAGHLQTPSNKKTDKQTYRYLYQDASGAPRSFLDSRLKYPLVGGIDNLEAGAVAPAEEFLGSSVKRVSLIDPTGDDRAWQEIVGQTLEVSEAFVNDVAQFCFKLGAYWDNLSLPEKGLHAAMYLEFQECTDVVDAKLEWVLPDEDSDFVAAKIDLESGRVFFAPNRIPEGLSNSYLRFRVEYEEDLFEVSTVWHDDVLSSVKLTKKALLEINTLVLNMS